MSERLIKKVNDALIKKGMDALEKASGLAETTIREIALQRRVPRRSSAYKLALACGCGEEEALSIAYECASERARETA